MNLKQSQGKIKPMELRKQLENVLGDSSSIPEDMFILWDRELNFKNAVLFDKSRIPLAEEMLVGQNLQDMIPQVKGNGIYEAFEEVIRNGEPLSMRELMLKIGDDELKVDVKAFKVGDDLGMMISNIEKFEHMKLDLEELKRRYRAMFDNRMQMVFVNDRNGILLDANEYTLNRLGYSGSDMGVVSIQDMIYHEDLAKALHVLNNVATKGCMEKPLEIRLISKSGEIFWIETIGLPMTDDPDCYLALGIARDITEKKQAEAALKDSEEQFRHLVEEMNDGYLAVQNSKVVFANRRCADMLGYKLEDIEGKSILNFLAHDAIAKLADLHVRRLRGEPVPQQYEMPFKKKDGEECTIEFSVKMIEYKEKRAVSILIRDVTERKRMEEQLEKREKTYRMLFENRIDGVLVIDAQTLDIIISNEAVAKMFGFDSAEEIIGLNPLDYFLAENKELARNLMVDDMFEKDLRHIREIKALTKNGKEIWISALGMRMEYEGRMVGIVSIRDITEQKTTEKEKKQMEQQLQLAGRLAAVGELAAGVAHELNNPLASVQAYSELLTSRNDLDISLRADIEMIYKEAKRASRITANLLSFARRHVPEKRLVSVNDALEKSLELHVYRMNVNNIDIVRDFDPAVPLIMADFHQLQQIFVNIITNAEQAITGYMGKGKLIVKTMCKNNMIRITFKDNGPGIAEQNLKRVFDPFFTTKEVGEGTGLGLSICYGLVQGHGGTIHAENAPDGGAVFIIELPIISKTDVDSDVVHTIRK